MPKPEERKSARAPLRQDVSDRVADSRGAGETEFEKPRGVKWVEIKSGLTRAFVYDLPEPVTDSRLEVLSRVRAAGVSIDFVKFGQGAMSFVAAQADQPALESALKGASAEIEGGCCVVIVHAVNMQDEEGLVARIVSEVIASGESVDHIGDMHDRVLLVADQKIGERLVKKLEKSFAREGTA